MPLLIPRKSYKPFEYPWAYEACMTQHRAHWIPQEVSLADDIKDWRSTMTDKERNLLTQIFRFFTQSDIAVHECYMLEYTKIFKAPEISMMLTAFSNMETLHIIAYAYLLDTLGLPESEYGMFLKFQQLRAKYDFLQSFNCNSIYETAKTLAIFGAFTEGLMLFSSFAILLNPQRFNKLKGVGQIVAWSARDETLHTQSIIKLYHTLLKEECDKIDIPKLQGEIVEYCKEVIRLEDDFLDLAYSMGDVEGLAKDDLKLYIRFIANYRLSQLDIDVKPFLQHGKLENKSKHLLFDVSHNPLPWLDEILNGHEFTNFFENRSTEYSKASMTGEWGDAFVI